MAKKIQIPKTESIDISEIKNNPDNPRFIRDENFEKLVNSIKAAPWMLAIRPIVVNAEMVVLGGNMRLRACETAGLKQVPVIRVEDLTPDQEREFIIKDNVGFGEWEMEVLANEWNADELNEFGFDTPDNWGKDIEELQPPEQTPNFNVKVLFNSGEEQTQGINKIRELGFECSTS